MMSTANKQEIHRKSWFIDSKTMFLLLFCNFLAQVGLFLHSSAYPILLGFFLWPILLEMADNTQVKTLSFQYTLSFLQIFWLLSSLFISLVLKDIPMIKIIAFCLSNDRFSLFPSINTKVERYKECALEREGVQYFCLCTGILEGCPHSVTGSVSAFYR